jgi:hypothetical protein
MERDDRIRQYYLKNSLKEFVYSPSESDTTSGMSDFYEPTREWTKMTETRKIRVIDRFGIIL